MIRLVLAFAGIHIGVCVILVVFRAREKTRAGG